jgi:Ca-activated chloride channel family protein
MSTYQIHSVQMLHLLWGLPLLVLVFVYAGHQRRQALARFAEAGILKRLNITADPIRRRWKAFWLLMGCAFVVVALVRPAWNLKAKTVHRQGRDVVFILDVSRSMLAEDLVPNRLERAKLAILDCINTFEGDRVGLVAFAGTAAVKCPLTLDYGFFRMMLSQISTDSISRGGTNIGDAIRCALDQEFDDTNRAYRDIILITDGGDQESLPVAAAERAGKEKVRILAIGLGDEDNQRVIHITDPKTGQKEVIRHDGKRAPISLNADLLRKIASATPGGKYLNVATGTINLDQVYADLVASAQKRDVEAKTIKRYEEKFQIFLGIAIAILIAESLMNERRKRRPAREAEA